MDYRIFSVRTGINACDCTRACTDTLRQSVLKVDSGIKIKKINSFPHRGIELVSAVCRSDTLRTELHPHFSCVGLSGYRRYATYFLLSNSLLFSPVLFKQAIAFIFPNSVRTLYRHSSLNLISPQSPYNMKQWPVMLALNQIFYSRFDKMWFALIWYICFWIIAVWNYDTSGFGLRAKIKSQHITPHAFSITVF